MDSQVRDMLQNPKKGTIIVIQYSSDAISVSRTICDFRSRHSCSNFIKRLGIGIVPGNETKNSADSEPVFVYHWGDITILAHRTLISHCMIARDRVQFMRSLLTVLGQVSKQNYKKLYRFN